MAAEYDLIDRHKGEALELLISAKAPDGSILPDAANQVMTIRLSETPGGDPLMSFSDAPQVVLSDVVEAKWFIQLTKTNLQTLKERRTYYYNIWSQLTGEPQRLQAKGKILLDRSIDV